MPPKRARKQPTGPGLFDDLDDSTPESTEAPAEAPVILPFAERVAPPEPRPASFAKRVRPVPVPPPQPAATIASGEKGKARDILAAIRTLQTIERQHRPANADEREVLAKFPGFGPVALSIFPNPATGEYKDAGWQAIGEELKALLTPNRNATRPSVPPSTPSTPRRPSSTAMHSGPQHASACLMNALTAGARLRHRTTSCGRGSGTSASNSTAITGRIAKRVAP